jgi:hypothetical protein
MIHPVVEMISLHCSIDFWTDTGKLKAVSVYGVPQDLFDRLPGRRKDSTYQDVRVVWKQFGKYITFYLDI